MALSGDLKQSKMLKKFYSSKMDKKGGKLPPIADEQREEIIQIIYK